MKPLVLLGSLVLTQMAAVAQISIRSTDLPSLPHENRRAYFEKPEIPVADRIGTTGGPQHWDFSYPRRSTEIVYNLEMVPADAGSCSAKAVGAKYAERTTRADSGCSSFEYYSLDEGRGRLYWGMCDPCGNPSGTGVVFKSSTLELPDCTYGDSWERTVEWDDLIDPGIGPVEIAVQFVSNSRVDAFGTLRLPNLGDVPALRVNETNTYTTFWKDLGIPLGSQTFHNLYWLVPKIGRAVYLVSKASASGVPSLAALPGSIIRVFEADLDGEEIKPVTGLRAERSGRSLKLSWDTMSVGAQYVIGRGTGGPVLGTPAATDPLTWERPHPLVVGWSAFTTNTTNHLVVEPGLGHGIEVFRVGWLP